MLSAGIVRRALPGSGAIMPQIAADAFAARFPSIAEALRPDELQAFVGLLKRQELEASESLIAEGTQADSLFFLWDGELNIVMNTPDGERQVALITENELFGEISLMSPGVATATVRSDSGCTALHLDRASLEAFWQQYPHAGSVFLNVLSRQVARRIRAANETLDALRRETRERQLPAALLKAHGQLFEERPS
jgi:CRP-like cAMP-binding protein